MTWERLWPASGIAYVALLALPFVTDSSSGTTDAEISAYYADAGHRTLDTVLYFAMLGAGLALLVFATGLRGAISRAAGSATLADIAFVAGTVSAALTITTGAIWVSASAAHADASFVLDPNTVRLVGNVGYWLLAAATSVGGLLVLAASLAAVRAGLMWRWLAWTGVAVAAVSVAAVTFLPLLVYAAWFLLVAVSLLVRVPAHTIDGERRVVLEVDAVARPDLT